MVKNNYKPFHFAYILLYDVNKSLFMHQVTFLGLYDQQFCLLSLNFTTQLLCFANLD